MAKVLQFKPRSRLNTQSLKLMRFSDEIDEVLRRNLDQGELEMREIVCLLSHRLGSLLSHVDAKERDLLWGLCEKILKGQAELVSK